MADPRTPIRDLVVKLEKSHPAILEYFRQLLQSIKLDKCVMHELSENKIKRIVTVKCVFRFFYASILIHSYRILTWDEKWIIYDNRWHSAQWLDRGKSRQQFPKEDNGDNLLVVRWSDSLQRPESMQNPHGTRNQWNSPQTITPAPDIGQQKWSHSSSRQCPTTRCITYTAETERIKLQNSASPTLLTRPLMNRLLYF